MHRNRRIREKHRVDSKLQFPHREEAGEHRCKKAAYVFQNFHPPSKPDFNREGAQTQER